MRLYVFRCRARPGIYGATRFETASNLPRDRCSGGWEFYQRVDLTPKGTLRFAVDITLLRHQVQKNGWFVWDDSSPEARQGVAPEDRLVRREEERPPAEHEPAASDVAWVPTTKKVPPATPKVPSATPKAPSAMPKVSPAAPEVAPARPVVLATPPEETRARTVSTLPVRHQVVWFDIPTRDLDRAVRFYSAVLGMQLKKEQAGPGVAIAMLPHAEGSIGGCLVQNLDARPSESGPLLYLNTQDRLDQALNAVEKYGGKILAARHSISPFGFRAIVLDSEGNRIALHSM